VVLATNGSAGERHEGKSKMDSNLRSALSVLLLTGLALCAVRCGGGGSGGGDLDVVAFSATLQSPRV
jgi:hypothetical protein